MKFICNRVLIGASSIALLTQSVAFSPTKKPNIHRQTRLSEKSEDYLRELWQQEATIERDIIVQDTIENRDATKHIVSEMLETALEHVHVLEKEKARHAKEANERFEHAAQEERVLNEFVEDYALADGSAPVVDDYIASRLREAEAEELEAMQEEDEAVREYKDLKNKEENIKDLLMQMKKLEP